MSRTGGLEGRGAGVQRSARGDDIVDEQQAASRDAARLSDLKSGTDVGAALAARESGLRFRRTGAADEAFNGQTGAFRKHSGEERGLVEAAVHTAAPMKRHRYDGVKALVARKRAEQHAPERPVERADAVILEEMNEFAQCSFVGSEAVGGVETVRAHTAGQADAILIERMGIQEGRAAAYAIDLGHEGGGAFKTRAANRNAGEFFEFRATDPALIGKEKRKQGGSGFTEPVAGGDPEVVRNPCTGEDSPPAHSIPQ